MSRAASTAAATILLAACGSSPKVTFYTLTRTPGAAPPAAVAFPVQVSAVHLPPSLDRRQLVRMSAPNRVDISDTERWSASLDDMMRKVLSEDLAARLPLGRVIFPGAPAPTDTATLVVTVAEFAADASGHVKLTGGWALLRSGEASPVERQDFDVDGGRAVTPDATVEAMSAAVGQLATEIASRVTALGAEPARPATARRLPASDGRSTTSAPR